MSYSEENPDTCKGTNKIKFDPPPAADFHLTVFLGVIDIPNTSPQTPNTFK